MMIVQPALARVKPAAVVLFDSPASRTPKSFVKGLLRSTGPAFKAEYNPADAAWWAEESDRRGRERAAGETEARIEAMADDAAAFRAYVAVAAYASPEWHEAEVAECFGVNAPKMSGRD